MRLPTHTDMTYLDAEAKDKHSGSGKLQMIQKRLKTKRKSRSEIRQPQVRTRIVIANDND